MSIRVGIGCSAVPDPAIAVERALRRALAQNPNPDLALLIGSADLPHPEVHRRLREKLPNVPLMGASSSMELSNAGPIKGTLMIVLLTLPGVDVSLFISGDHPETPELAGEEVGRQILAAHPDLPSSQTPAAAMVFPGEFHFAGARFLTGLESVLPGRLAITGGGSLNSADLYPDDLEFFRGHQYCNDVTHRNSLPLLLLRPRADSDVHMAWAFESSWTPVAKPVVCTRAEGPQVFELDGIPIVEYFRRHFGDDFLNDPEGFLTFTFIERKATPQGEIFLIRSPGAIGPGGDSSTFFPRVDMQGMTLQMVQLSKEELIQGDERAARSILASLGGKKPAIVFVFACHMRRVFLHSLFEREILELRKVFGDDVPIVGFYAGGEYAPLFNTWEQLSSCQVRSSMGCQLSTSVSLFALGDAVNTSAGSGPQNFHDLIRAALEEDWRDFPGCNPEHCAQTRLREDLHVAERNLMSTERALKRLNGMHIKMAEELEAKNKRLEELVSQNKKLQKIIRQYTPRKVWDKAHKSVEMGLYRIPDEENNCAIMFMDVKGFTSFAEKHQPVEVIREINRIFEPAVHIIYENGGDIDKFIGDCIFALFDDCVSAFRSAREIQEELKSLRAEGFPFSMRVGINFGRVVRGNVGGYSRRENTLIGDAVNLAQRLESNCTPGAILLAEEVYRQIGDELSPEDQVSPREITVKGKAAPIKVFEVAV